MSNHTHQQERGIALFLVIMALFLVTAVGAGLIVLSNSEVRTSANYRDEQIALYAAKAGLEEARDRMLPSNANPLVLPVVSPTAALPGSAGGVVYITASGVSPWSSTSTKFGISMYDTEILKELTAAGATSPPAGTWYASTASSAGYSGPSGNPVPYQWVRVNLKVDASATPYLVDGTAANKGNQVCYDMANLHEVVISAASCTAANANYLPVYEVTSFAMTPSLTFRMLQQDVVKDFVHVNLPGALTVAGPSLASSVICANGDTCSSGGDYITGNNDASCTTGANVPAIATSDSTTQSNFSTGVTPNQSNIVGTGGSPSISNASSALSGLSTVNQIETLVSEYKSLAGGNVGPDCSTLNLGTAASPTITVVTNAGGTSCNLSSGATGYGILVVTGTLTYVNVNSYQGVILMLGTGQFISSSSKDTTVTGAVFIAQDRDPTTGALLPGPALGTTPVFNYHHGNASSTDPSIQYNACVISQAESNTVPNFRVLSQREVGYQ
jgi:hypothetical protein